MLRKYLRCLAIGIALIVSTGLAAQPFPNRPVKLMVGFGPGGSNDVVARLFAQRMSETLGQSVVVENRAGAAGAIAADQVAKAEPDGYRLLLLSSTTILYTVFTKNVPFNMARDFTPISFVGQVPLVLVVNDAIPAKNFNEFVEYARSKPGKLTFASEGTGATSHMAGELFKLMTKTDLLHVPFKTSAESTAATAGGQTDMTIPSITSALPLLGTGKIRALAVTSLKRSPLLPSTPTLDESGLKGYEVTAWFGFVGPPGMPQAIGDKLHAAIVEAANTSSIREAMGKQGFELRTSSPEELGAMIRATISQTAQLAKDANLKME